METEEDVVVKEHVERAAPLALRWLVLALAGGVALAALAAAADSALPAARPAATTPAREFSAERAYTHLLNLTGVGARVAGSLENEVVAVGALVAALKEVARTAAPHQRLELDVFTADGAFPLAFLDGMNNVYRGVSAVVARLSARPATPAPRAALLFNCHYDTVPDSPGASDDGAGCAVLLEVLRALAAADARPHDALFLFNGAEENILQAAHGFVARHRWAGAARAFVNLEACGAGGRELVFQAGPRAGRLLDAYAAAAPRPFASSLAQELFRSGLVPADTDFRVFRDHARLPGLDLAWSADGYVYHTRLDAPDRLPPAALQRAGDNVLALAHGARSSLSGHSWSFEPDNLNNYVQRMSYIQIPGESAASEVLGGEWLARAPDDQADEGEPVFFDVLGVWMVTLRPRAATVAALLVLALVAADLRRAARHARLHLGLSGGAWARAVLAAAAGVVAAGASGALVAAAVALPLWALDRRLAYYARPWLLLPLFVLPALAAAAHVLRAALRVAHVPRGWWRARAVATACGSLAAAVLLGCLVTGLRAGYLPAVSAAGAALAGSMAGRRTNGARALLAALGLAPGALLACYLSAGTLRVLVPLAGRAGGGADVWLGAATAALALGGAMWLAPLVAVARDTRALERGAWLACAAALALVRLQAGDAAYSALAPQRVMVFHTRLTEHAKGAREPELRYWVPALDDNTARTLGRAGLAARSVPGAECARRVWCAAPYYLPVRTLVPHWYVAEAREPPLVQLAVNVSVQETGSQRRVLVRLEGAQHAVVLAAPAPGVQLARAAPLVGAPQESAAWGARRTHFFLLHDARAPRPFTLELELEGAGAGAGEWCALLVAGHALFGPHKLAAAHARLLAALPAHTAATGWGADMHLYSV